MSITITRVCCVCVKAVKCVPSVIHGVTRSVVILEFSVVGSLRCRTMALCCSWSQTIAARGILANESSAVDDYIYSLYWAAATMSSTGKYISVTQILLDIRSGCYPC